MPASRISFHPGKPSFAEIHISTPSPLDWVTFVRHSFISLLECFHEPLPSDVSYLQSYAVGLLCSLHPLLAQMKAGVMELNTPPDAHENEGYYFTPGGLVLRLQITTFEGLDTTLRALLAVGQYSGCRLSDEIRTGYFELLGALIASPTDISATLPGI
ncbi:MAG: hypothetical protein ACKVT2_18025 [Saprospiraceae bacterium]